MKQLAFIIAVNFSLSLLNSIDFYSDKLAIEYKYYNNFHSFNRVSLSIPTYTTDYYEFTPDVSMLSWLTKDKYNRNNSNVSISGLTQLGLSGLGSIVLPSKVKPTASAIMNSISSFNYFYLYGTPYFDKKDLPNFKVAIFIKNHYDIFVLRKEKWLGLSPGIGIKIFYKYFGVNIGYEKEIHFIGNRTPMCNNGFFFSIAGYITHLE
ncbi:MAG: hypothetical protein PHR06_14060 [Candidatus Cloacimonetes bacterium]|nr:hypothetical protein [Candidatus Cloacimonadota bacterium]